MDIQLDQQAVSLQAKDHKAPQLQRQTRREEALSTGSAVGSSNAIPWTFGST